MVGQSFLQACSSSPELDGPASSAIWATCWVSNDGSDLPTPSNCSASAILLIISPASGEPPELEMGGGLVMMASSPLEAGALVLSTWVTPFSPFLRVTLVLAMLEFRQARLANGKVVQPQSQENHVATILNF